jgi:hypothetical protein
MATSTTSYTAGEVMDRSAVLMNDPNKTDYTHVVLLPFLRMAVDELQDNLVDNQDGVMSYDYAGIILPKGSNSIWQPSSLNTPVYPEHLVEIQEVAERTVGSDAAFVPLTKVEYPPDRPATDMLEEWAWNSQIIKFNVRGCTTDRQIRLKYLVNGIISDLTPATSLGYLNAQSFLAYKTAAYAAMFIGENPQRAQVLDGKAEMALERVISINNKGRQQMMTRHRPFRAAFKMRGGF